MTTPQVKTRPSAEVPVFAYLRRSTKKDEQEMSLEDQKRSVRQIAKEIGIPFDRVVIFDDSYSGYKIKTKNGTPQSRRKGYIDLMKEMSASKVPCILLAFNVARLGRNIPEGIIICEKLGGYGNSKIQKVEYIRFFDGVIWDRNTPESEITDAFKKAEWYSATLSKQRVSKNLTFLADDIIATTIKMPKWLKATRKGIKETEAMPHILRAFEIKAKGATGKEISEYLATYGIRIKEGNLKSLFSKTVFVGTYTHPSGIVCENIKFINGNPPIPISLWNKVQECFGKKWAWIKPKQNGDSISRLLRWVQDTEKRYTFTIDTKEGLYENYKSNAYWGFNKSALKVSQQCLEEIVPKVVWLYYELFEQQIQKVQQIPSGGLDLEKSFDKIHNHLMSFDREKRRDIRKLYDRIQSARFAMILYSFGKDHTTFQTLWIKEQEERVKEVVKDGNNQLYSHKKFNPTRYRTERIKTFLKLQDQEYKNLEKEYISLDMEYWGNFRSLFTEEEWQEQIADYYHIDAISINARKTLENAIRQARSFEEDDREKEEKENERSHIKKEIQMSKDEIQKIPKRVFLQGFGKELSDDLVNDEKQKLEELERRLSELSESTDLEAFFEKLPEILSKIFELLDKVLSKTKLSEVRGDFFRLLEIVTFELVIDTKKELKIKLFDGIENWISWMVGDIGFEPMTPCV
jgi:Resolvase, N terminal domain